MEETTEQYIKRLIDEGYTKEDGTPLKCLFCESKKLDAQYYYGDYGVTEEIEIICEDCKKNVGHWAYGTWSIV